MVTQTIAEQAADAGIMSGSFVDPTKYGANALLLGGSGTGKTHACRTLHRALRAHDPEAQVLTLFTEPRWQPLVKLTCNDGLHIRYIPPVSSSWDAMIGRSKDLLKFPWDSVVKKSDSQKHTYDAYVKLLESCAGYKCDRCGQEFGDVTEIPPTWGFWLDSLSGINHMAMQMVVGGAVAKSQPQWGAAMDSEMQVLNTLCYEMKGWFVLVAHIERMVDEINGGMIIQANALGRKNAPELPKNFDDVIHAVRTGTQFKWSNMTANVDTKPSWLPISDNLAPDFAPMVKAWVGARESADS